MKKSIFSYFLLVLSLAGLTQENSVMDASQAIRDIHDGWLIVRLPGFEKKLTTLDSLLDNTSLSDKSRATLELERSVTIAQRDFIHQWYPKAFDSLYTFSRLGFIYNHETARFQKGEMPARTVNGDALDSVHLSNYFFATLNGVANDPIQFASKDHRVLPYPFPNNIALPGFIMPGVFSGEMPGWMRNLGDESMAVYRAYRHAFRVNRKLKKFLVRQELVNPDNQR